MVVESNPCGGEVFLFSPNRPDQLWGPLIIVFSEYHGFFFRVKRPGREVTHPYNIEVKVVGAVLLLLLHAFFVASTGTTLPFIKSQNKYLNFCVDRGHTPYDIFFFADIVYKRTYKFCENCCSQVNGSPQI